MTSAKAAAIARVGPEGHPDSNIVLTIDRDMLDTAFTRQATVTSMFKALRRYWWLWVCSVFAAAGLGYHVAATLPELYRASVVLFPPQRESNLAQFPTRLLGINVGSASPSTDEALATLTSAQFLGAFIKEHNLFPALFPDQWDSVKQAWRQDVVQPTLLAAVSRFKANLEVERSVATPVVTLAFFHADAKVAASAANNLVSNLNATMREKAIARSRDIVDQYYQQLRSDTLTEVRSHILTLITDELKILVSARGTEDFAFRIIDPASVPEQISYPNKVLILALACVFGLFFGIFLSLLLHFYRSADGRP